ncbi:alpha-glucosidase C-terminal domain-containing protein, partial [Flavobacteriaceae bacterium]|nr:alpha-glucosidase C-terminal domain-containing protein [Flavobacteriaceae bacterium]
LLNIDSKVKFEVIEIENKNIVCYKRSKANESIYFIANLSDEILEFKTGIKGNFQSIIKKSNYTLESNTLKGWEFHILK